MTATAAVMLQDCRWQDAEWPYAMSWETLRCETLRCCVDLLVDLDCYFLHGLHIRALCLVPDDE